MVDAKPPLTPTPGTPTAAFSNERSKIKLLIERTPSIGTLKSKLLTVLGNSNELINGISNKLTFSSSSSDSDYCEDEEELPKFDETIDYTEIDFEARRIKARRAHEEIISGRFRLPNLAAPTRLEFSGVHSADKLGKGHVRSSSDSSSSTCGSSSDDSSSLSLPEQSAARSNDAASSTTHSNSMEIESRNSGGYARARAIAGARRSELDLQKDMQRISELLDASIKAPQIDVQSPTETPVCGAGVGNETLVEQITRQQWGAVRVPIRNTHTSNSSTLTSLRDEPDQIHGSPSMESSDWRNFIRSESQNSVPSWASSISLDCRTGEEPVKEFMKHFTHLLFNNFMAVNLELKSEFGVLLRLEIGRLWFTRFLSVQRNRSKRLESSTLNALAQYYALALFECAEFEDYGPATVLMNLCFLFYHEVEVPGCDPYREYLFVSMRTQPIWQKMRFWNAAFLDAIQSEREHRHTKQLRRQQRCQSKQKHRLAIVETSRDARDMNMTMSTPKLESTSSSSHHGAATTTTISKHNLRSNKGNLIMQGEQPVKDREDIVFRQLSAFTCNMHSLGASHEMCIDFLMKNLIVHNLSHDKAKLIRDNINRMYQETKLWGAVQC
ncbi:uncharacterized protein KIAA0513 [Drosophila sulfurigaster albostrigata]|uniref:uncharacterized protein KIAA0513 n=1 Tax=Drosophila sulfurigaster albostrigata TaxID=89887 RepID=UPI002D21AE7D|nr:uncharacterized protein KIAA0513 [Drosophila sulfurigaster albostrigata]